MKEIDDHAYYAMVMLYCLKTCNLVLIAYNDNNVCKAINGLDTTMSRSDVYDLLIIC